MCRCIVSLLAGFLALPLAAQPQTNSASLDAARQLADVAQQKTESDIRSLLQVVGKLEKSDRPVAIQKLKDAIAALDADSTFAQSKKATLLRVLRDRLRIAELGPDSAEALAKQKQDDATRNAGNQELAARQAEQNAKVKEGLAKANQLRKDGKHAEAEKIIRDLAGKYPDSLVLQLLTNQISNVNAVKAADKDRKDADAKVLAAIREAEFAGTPIEGNVAFPSDFKQATKNRRDDSGPTAEERAMVRSLETLIDARYKNSRLQDVLDHIGTAINRTIIADAAALTDAAISYDSLVNFTAREPIAARTALRSILASLNLTYVVRDNIIHITSPVKARDLMTTKVYYLGDLIVGAGPYGGTPTIGISNDQIQTVNNINALVEMITGAIDPQSWEKRGGQGHLGVNLPTLSLTVRQSQEVHTMLRSTLYGNKK